MVLMEARNLRKERTGVVVSNKMDKTITVAAKFMLLLPLALGMDGVLWAGPISDGVAAVLVLVLGAREVRRLTVQQEETP